MTRPSSSAVIGRPLEPLPGFPRSPYVAQPRLPAELVHPAAVRLRDAAEVVVQVAQGRDLRLAGS